VEKLETPNENEKEAETSSKPWKHSRWVVPVVLALLSIVVTIGVAWFQFSKLEEEMREAELEREKAVRSTVVSIVEEHILNEKELDISRLARLTEHLSREYTLRRSIPISELLEKAEFNILNSRYLDFEKKEKYKTVFNTIYKELPQVSTLRYDGRHADLVNDLVSSLQAGQSQDTETKLNRVLQAFNSDIEHLAAQRKPETSIPNLLRSIKESPYAILFVVFVYLLFGVYGYFQIQARRRRRERQANQDRIYEQLRADMETKGPNM